MYPMELQLSSLPLLGYSGVIFTKTDISEPFPDPPPSFAGHLSSTGLSEGYHPYINQTTRFTKNTESWVSDRPVFL